MNSASNTNFLATSGNRIMQGSKGGFFTMKKDGTKKYQPKAAFRQVGNGLRSKVTATNVNVPAALRRKVRKNAGVKRGPSTVVRKAAPGRKPTTVKGMMKAGMTPNEGDLFRQIFKTPPVRKTAVRKIGPSLPRGRKATTVKGMMKAGMTPNEGDLFRQIFKTPPARKTAVRKIGPSRPRGRKATTVKGMMKAGMTPNEGDLTRMLFKTPPARKARAPVARKARVPARPRGRKPTTVKGMMKAGMTPNAGDLTRMLFKTPPARKARAAPKSRLMAKPKATRPILNLIVVSPGGTSTVKKIRKPRAAVAKVPKGERKVRKNKGVKRGPRGVKGMRVNKNPFQALA